MPFRLIISLAYAELRVWVAVNEVKGDLEFRWDGGFPGWMEIEGAMPCDGDERLVSTTRKQANFIIVLVVLAFEWVADEEPLFKLKLK